MFGGAFEEIASEVWDHLIKEVDVNGDGEVIFNIYYIFLSLWLFNYLQISLAEFKEMMLKLSSE